MKQGIVEEIVKVVNDMGARDKYSLVLDKSGTTMSGTNLVLYSQDVKDITDDLIKTINASKPADGSSSAVPGASSTAPASAGAAGTPAAKPAPATPPAKQ